MAGDSPMQSVQSLDRAAALLRALAARGSESGVSELSREVGLGKTTVHRLLNALVSHRLVEQDPSSGKYHLGWGLFELGNRVPAYVNLHKVCRPVMEELCQQSGETVNLAIPDRTDGVIIDKVEPPRVLRAYLELGTREPLHATALGKALLMDQTADEITALFGNAQLSRITSHTCGSVAELMTRIGEAKKTGVAFDDQELTPNLRCIGAPIRGHTGQIQAAISLSGPSHRMTEDRLASLKQTLLGSAMRISMSLGYAFQSTS